jgi:hypothetical protein
LRRRVYETTSFASMKRGYIRGIPLMPAFFAYFLFW